MNTEQQRRERAYKIWENEGRPEGQHEDHWRRADEASERDAADVTEANQEASDEFNGDKASGLAIDIRPTSTVSPD